MLTALFEWHGKGTSRCIAALLRSASVLVAAALMASPASAVLLGVNSAQKFRAEVDPATGATSRLNPNFSVGTDAVSLTYDAASDTVFGIGYLGTVITRDPATGFATVLSSAPLGDITGAVHFDQTSGGLFTVDAYLDDALVRVDPATGAITPVSVIGFESVNAITGHANGKICAIANLSNELLTIDLTTGAGTSIASLSTTHDFIALTYLPDTNQVLALLSFGRLVEVDVTTGAVPTIGSTQLDALVFVPEPGTGVLFGLGLGLLGALKRSTRR